MMDLKAIKALNRRAERKVYGIGNEYIKKVKGSEKNNGKYKRI